MDITPTPQTPPPRKSPLISHGFDPDEFRPFLSGFGMSEETENELLQSLWTIIYACAEIGFKGDVITLIFQEIENDEGVKAVK